MLQYEQGTFAFDDDAAKRKKNHYFINLKKVKKEMKGKKNLPVVVVVDVVRVVVVDVVRVAGVKSTPESSGTSINLSFRASLSILFEVILFSVMENETNIIFHAKNIDFNFKFT